MAPIGEIKMDDIDFDSVKECNNYKTIKAYIKLLEDDGSYFEDLLKACRNRLLELNPKEYYLLYPRSANQDEVDDAMRDIFEWEAAVKETDASLKKTRDGRIVDAAERVSAPIRGQEATLARPNIQQTPGQPKAGHQKQEDVYARDKTAMRDYYSAWDKVDVDALEEELDEDERKQEESRRRHFEDLKDQQDEAHRMTPVEVGNLPSGVPEAHRKHMADSEKEKGNEAFYSKDWEEAEAYYSRSLHFRADDPSTWANRALVRLKRENASGALHDCDRALDLNPRYMKALHRRGKALHELKRYEEAVRSFQLALAESPGNTQINGDLMVSRRHLRDPPPAPVASQPKSRTIGTSGGVIIEELDDDDDEPFGGGAGGGPRAERSDPAPGYTRVMIEEDSESEEEDDARARSAGGQVASSAVAAAAPSSGSRGFTKVAIEEVSGSESEDEAAPRKKDASGATASAASPASAASAARDNGAAGVARAAPAFNPPPRAGAAAPAPVPPAPAAPSAPAPVPAAAVEGRSAVSFDDMD